MGKYLTHEEADRIMLAALRPDEHPFQGRLVDKIKQEKATREENARQPRR